MTLAIETTVELLATVGPDEFVLPASVTAGSSSRGPRFADDVWDLREFLPRTHRFGRVDFTHFTPGLQRLTAKEYAFACLRVVPRHARRPMKPTTLPAEISTLARVWRDLNAVGVRRLQDIRDEHLKAVLALRRPSGPHAVEAHVATIKRIAALGLHLSADRITFIPWPYRSAKQIAGVKTPTENSTPRIPEEIMRPYLAAALFYVQVASNDLFAAQRELDRLEQTCTEHVATYGPKSGRGLGAAGESPARTKLEAFIARRREEGRGIPALPLQFAHTVPGAKVVDGIVQAPNLAMIASLAGCRFLGHLRQLIVRAGDELGWEEGGIDTPRALWPATGEPWRPELSPVTLNKEFGYVRTACWIVIAYLSGMRDMEVRELSRDCAFTEVGADGRTRYKIRGCVYKGRKISGDEADWVVLDVVHQAVNVLKRLNDDPTHLFGYRVGDVAGYGIPRNMIAALNNFRDHVNDLFSTTDGPYIPLPLSGSHGDMPNNEAEETEAGADEGSPPEADEVSGEMADEPLPWSFNSSQFRRTLAWHIANQPFGVVAGTRQYKHASFAIFEGYAGTSASGFADEVAADKAVAKLDYVEDLYHDWNEGGRSAGGAVKRIEAEFDRIRGELGDLPGVVASPERLRTMLRHLTLTLHPGALNDCFHHADTAVCGKRAQSVGRPLPMLNMCLSCPNSRRSSVHLPRYRQTRAAAEQEFKGAKNVPSHQQTAITEFITMLDSAITELTTEEAARP